MTTYTDDELAIRDNDLQPGVWVESGGSENIIGKSQKSNRWITEYLGNSTFIIWGKDADEFSRLSAPSEVPEQFRAEWEGRLAELRPRSAIDPHCPVEGVTLWNSQACVSKKDGSQTKVDGEVAGYLYGTGSFVEGESGLSYKYPRTTLNPNFTEELLTDIRNNVRVERKAEADKDKPTAYTAATFPKGVVWIRHKKWPKREILVSDKDDSGAGSYGHIIDWATLANNFELSTDGGDNWREARP